MFGVPWRHIKSSKRSAFSQWVHIWCAVHKQHTLPGHIYKSKHRACEMQIHIPTTFLLRPPSPHPPKMKDYISGARELPYSPRVVMLLLLLFLHAFWGGSEPRWNLIKWIFLSSRDNCVKYVDVDDCLTVGRNEYSLCDRRYLWDGVIYFCMWHKILK